jgi:hypothetical protein
MKFTGAIVPHDLIGGRASNLRMMVFSAGHFLRLDPPFIAKRCSARHHYAVKSKAATASTFRSQPLDSKASPEKVKMC